MNKEFAERHAEQCLHLGDVMSNFDHVIDADIAQQLQVEPMTRAGQPAWHYYGVVFWLDGQFHEIVRCYGSVSAVFSAPTLQELFDVVCDEYSGE